MTDQEWMSFALEEAQNAFDEEEVPVGAILVRNGEVVASAHNATEKDHSPLSHAECKAITLAAEKLGRYALSECALYVTMEPCPMCAGAIRNAKIKRVVFGVPDPTMGAFGTVLHMEEYPFASPCPKVTGGVMAEESSHLLRTFFAERRKKGKYKKTNQA